MNLKVMARSYKGQNFILAVIDVVSNFTVTISIYQSRSEGIRDVLIEQVFNKYGIPECIIMDKDSVFMLSALTKYLFKKLDIKLRQLLLMISFFISRTWN